MIQQLIELISNPDVLPPERAEAGRKLAELGDPRAGVGLNSAGLPDLQWCEVPAGDFTMGGDEDAFRGQMAIEESMTYSYQIAKYPITVAQFTPFVQADGYHDQLWWTAAGWRWLQGTEKQEPFYWQHPRWHVSNHPIIGVSWFEGVAFTRWLSTQLNMLIRLPTEPEWEKAARYPDHRIFPWGNKYQSGYANIDETDVTVPYGEFNIGRTTAVGIYPQGVSAVGAMDMCGNVTEWGLSGWRLPYLPHALDMIRLEGEEARIWRGGSWYYGGINARSASRGWDYPYARDYALGFRVVHAQS